MVGPKWTVCDADDLTRRSTSQKLCRGKPAYDAQGKAVGFVCPGCLTQEDQRIDEIKEALLDEEDEEMLRREHAADDEEEF